MSTGRDSGMGCCGCCIWVVLVFVLGGLVSYIRDHVTVERDSEVQETVEKGAVARMGREQTEEQSAEIRARLREEKIRAFALKEAPGLWTAYQNLQSEIEVQNQKIVELRKTLADFDLDPESDPDFRHICSLRDDMDGSLKVMRVKMEDAYLASRKYEATPTRADYAELRRKLLEDGLQEAEAASRRYNQMRNAK